MSMTMGTRLALLATGVIVINLMPFAGGIVSSAAFGGPWMQAMADATLIDARCGTTSVMFGQMFHDGEKHGIRRGDILPLGKRRAEFQTAMDWRVKTTATSVICAALQDTYRDNFPSWFSAR